MSDDSAAAPAQVAHALFGALSSGSWDRLAELIHEDVVDDFLPIGRLHGRAAVLAFFRELRAAVPDLSIAPERIVGAGGSAAVMWRMTGTFRGGPFRGVEPSGRRLDLRGVDFLEIEGGRVRRNRVAYDGAEFARQVGLLPPRGSRTDRLLLAVFNARTRLAAGLRERLRAGLRSRG